MTVAVIKLPQMFLFSEFWIKGDHNMLYQNVPLQHNDYFDLKATEKQQTQSSLPSPYFLEAGHKNLCECVPLPASHTRRKILITGDKNSAVTQVCTNLTI